MTISDHAPSPRIAVTINGAVARIALDRPRERNPLDWRTIRELLEAVAAIEADAGVRVVTVAGNGGHFSSGGDLKGYIGLYSRPDDFRRFLEDFHELLNRMEASAKTYVAVVTGYCVAGGLELLLACDIAVAAASARIGDAHVNFGQLPGAGGSQRLPRAIGPVRAKYLMLTGDIVAAAEAERLGLLSAVVADEQLEVFVDALLAKLLATSPAGARGAKRLVNHGMQLGRAEALRMELEYVHDYATTCPDATEGLMAFHEKRKPRFSA